MLERVTLNFPAMSRYTIQGFRPGFYTLDPLDIQKFGDERQEFEYSEREQAETEPVDKAKSFPFAAVDSVCLSLPTLPICPSS